MPFLRDEGPPVSTQTIQDARATLPPEYGHKVVRENGRAVLLIRSPKARPDYLHELEDAALYIPLDDVKEVKDVLLIGSEKVCRLEPLVLRDHIRGRLNEDRGAAETLLRTLGRDYAWTVYKHPEHANRYSFAIRIPRGSVSEISPEDVKNVRARLAEVPRDTLMQATAAYLVADGNFERLGRRVFFELVDPELARTAPPPPSPVAPEWQPNRSTTPTKVAPGHGMGAPFLPQGGPPVSASSVPSVFQPPAPMLPQTAQRSGPTAFPPQAAAAKPAASARPTPPPKQLVSADDNIEVYVRKPAPAPEAAPAPELPPAPPPAPPPSVAASSMFGSLMTPPAPAAVASPAAPPVVAPPPAAPQDNGMTVEPLVSLKPPPAPPEPADPVAELDRRLRAMGYESVPGITVLGTIFDLAAHHKEGKRLLVKHVGRIQPAEVKGYEKVVRSVSADACVLVVDEVTPELRLATWGTPVEVLTPDEAAHLLE